MEEACEFLRKEEFLIKGNWVSKQKKTQLTASKIV
jgi:hypothetical protein